MPFPVTDFRLCEPRESTFAAYLVTSSRPGQLDPQTPNPRSMSGALLRALLINARECGGSVAMDELTGEIAFTYAEGTFHDMVQTAVPLTNRHSLCGTCGQWKSEHGNPNVTACDQFGIYPRAGTDFNPLCLAEDCGGYPRTHHGRRYTVACPAFEGPLFPEYEDPSVARDMGDLADLLYRVGVAYERHPDPKGAFRTTEGPEWIIRRVLDMPHVPDKPAARFFVGRTDADGTHHGAGPMDALAVAQFFV
ncbi:hypothetical protein OHS33_39180 (plasmid) [Streptomyces sp. NBC_00536]|uniref:hypothetical protein n=1 Tax=Streptomyces sp. NBC_00536 TaxID=2975769 RepID=UPI002E82103F|nr:hypothetical protein [Streptomyces sp. NBC_00536]WUC84383.1 hypothetical protein OHS33_39180 [Streptomyces sp. NBC_00536]